MPVFFLSIWTAILFIFLVAIAVVCSSSQSHFLSLTTIELWYIKLKKKNLLLRIQSLYLSALVFLFLDGQELQESRVTFLWPSATSSSLTPPSSLTQAKPSVTGHLFASSTLKEWNCPQCSNSPGPLFLARFPAVFVFLYLGDSFGHCLLYSVNEPLSMREVVA